MSKGFMRLALAALTVAAVTAFHVNVASATAISSGQLVNVRVGDGTTTATATALPVTLDVYNVTYTGLLPTSVSLVQSIPLPSAVTPPTSGDRNLTQGGTAGGEGGLSLSTNGQYMTLAGYNAAPGGPTNNTSTGSSDRVVGRLSLATGVVDTTTAISGFEVSTTTRGTAARGAFTTDGNDMWVAMSTGPRYVPFGTNPGGTGIMVANGANNARRVIVQNNTLYQTEAATSRSGIESIGPVGGPPPQTASSGTISLLPGFSTTNATYSAYDFFFADANTVYIADDISTNNKGLLKFTFDGTNWNKVFNHPIAANANSGIKGLTGTVDGSGNVVLFATTTGPNANFMFGLTDTLANTNTAAVTENLLVDASSAFTGGLWNLRGVAIAPVPEPTSIATVTILSAFGLARRRR